MNATPTGLRIIAVIEAFKGFVALMVAIGVHSLAGIHLQTMVEIAASHLHLNPANYLSSSFLNAHDILSTQQTRLIGLGALAYAMLRSIEAYGLWHSKRWTEWLALISAAIYVPFEVRSVLMPPAIFSWIALVINIAVVFYLAYVMFNPKFRKGDMSVA